MANSFGFMSAVEFLNLQQHDLAWFQKNRMSLQLRYHLTANDGNVSMVPLYHQDELHIAFFGSPKFTDVSGDKVALTQLWRTRGIY